LTKTQKQCSKDFAMNLLTKYEQKNRNENIIICPIKNCGDIGLSTKLFNKNKLKNIKNI